MGTVLLCLGRFAIILLGYLAASLAASAFINLLAFGLIGFDADEAPLAIESIILSIPFIALFVAYHAFIPALGAILLAEIIGAHDWLFHALAGAVVTIALIGIFRREAFFADPAMTAAVVGSGLFGGIIYWLVAGRTAGGWRGRPAADAISPER